MKYVTFILIIIVLSCVFYSYRPFMNFKGKDSIADGGNIEFTEEDYARKRERMVEQQIMARGVKDKKVLDVMESVCRHMFVPEEYRIYSYYDQPLPIGWRQTISQPYIVALMTEMLDVDKDDIVLEIGTGSGYQAAVLSTIAGEVYTIEIIELLN